MDPLTDLEPAPNSTIVRSEKKAGSARPPWIAALSMLDRAWPQAAARLSFDLFLRPRRFPRPARELEALASARTLLVPTDRTVHAAPHPLRAWVWGEDGPTVLLVHGWQGRGAQLAAFVPPLLSAGFRVVTFDAPGHGDTGGATSSLFAFRDAILAMHDALGPFHALVSHSMGGPAAVLAAEAASSRQLASRYALICPPNDVRDFTAELTKALGLSEATRHEVHRRLERRFGRSLESMRAPDMVARRSEPLLLVHDRGDREVPFDRGEAIARAWPSAELVATEGLGHRRILADPTVVARVVAHVGRRLSRPRGGSHGLPAFRRRERRAPWAAQRRAALPWVPMSNATARLCVEYDAGYFDKDEQGWCSNVHRLRVEGDVLHVEQSGDRNGLDPFHTRWEARIVEVDEPNEVVLLARGADAVVFDLRSQRLVGSWGDARQTCPLTTPPCFETVERFGRHGLALLESLHPVVAGPPPRAEHAEDVEHGSARRRTTVLRRGDTTVGQIDAFYTPPATLFGVDVSRAGLRIVVSWRSTAPLELELRGGLPGTELRGLRTVARGAVAPLLARPSLVLRALVAEAKEVGSMLSYLDHGGGEDAWARIHRAGVTAAALVSSLPEALADAGALDLARAFAENPSSRWIAIDELAASEVATRPTGPQESDVDERVVLQLRELDTEQARVAASALAGASR